MTHDMAWVSRQELREVLLPLATLCAEIERSSTLPENSRDDRPVWGFNDMSITLGQLRAVKLVHDKVSK